MYVVRKQYTMLPQMPDMYFKEFNNAKKYVDKAAKEWKECGYQISISNEDLNNFEVEIRYQPGKSGEIYFSFANYITINKIRFED